MATIIASQSRELVLMEFGTLVALVADPTASPKKAWAMNLAYSAQLLEEGKVEGYDPSEMKMLPMGVPADWGPDAGPNCAVVSAPPGGTPTQDSDGKVDDLQKAQAAARLLKGKKYTFPVDDASYKFILAIEWSKR